MTILEEFKTINKLLKESQDSKEIYNGSPIIREAKNNMVLLKDRLIKEFNIDIDFFKATVSTGSQVRIASSPWIGFLVKETAKSSESIYITFIFLPKKNSLFLTIQGKSNDYRTSKQMLFDVFEFYQNKFKKIQKQFNFNWNNSYIQNFKLVDQQEYTSLSNSYLFTSIFYQLIDLNNINEKELNDMIRKIFDIFYKVDIFYKNPWIMKHELDNYLYDIHKNELKNLDEYEDLMFELRRSKYNTFEEFVKESKKEMENLKLINSPEHFSSSEVNSADIKETKLRKTNVEIDADNINKMNKYKKFIGNVGEKAVLEYEKNFLKEHNRFDLAKKVKHVSLKNENAGYDILSYDLLGNKKFIEVKTSKNKYNKKINFFMSNSEKLFIENNDNCFIYFVGNIKDPANPQFYYQIKSDLEAFNFKPMNYSVSINMN